MATSVLAPGAPKSLSNLFIGVRSDVCKRCGQRVYPVEKLGPVNEVIFHRQCFKCSSCQHHLSLKTYYTNGLDLKDKEIYCVNHVPKYSAVGLDAEAVGIRGARHAPRARNLVNEQFLGAGKAPHITGEALGISQPVNAQAEFGRKNKIDQGQHSYPAFVINKREEILRAQRELEKKQREEEDRLMREILSKRAQEDAMMQQEMNEEWEVKLKELTAQFESEGRYAKKTKNKGDKQFDHEKDELKRNLTVRMQKKKEALTLKLQKKEQQETASLVAKHSEQMLEMLRQEQAKVKEELEKEISNGNDDGDGAIAIQVAMSALNLPRDLPPPHAPSCRKRDLYYDPVVFSDLDEEVFKIAERDHATFTDLVTDLTQHCISDLEKARAIFRWITVKDLNVIEFEGSYDTETPLGILRGIKYGTETYHTLFMRLCSYAGLACNEIKGHSKSVGYEPGMKIREDTFQNTWNAVLIEKDWWPVQCNWGARHLVLNKDVTEKPHVKGKKQDKIRYQYDEHYFLTDPDEFIQEFWAQDHEWQLLDKSVPLEEFESMPFVRSVFFHYGLEFDRDLKAVLYTDNKGGAEVKLRVPRDFAQDLVFHYQLRFADRERRNDTEFRGAKLERFVFHSLMEDFALFSVHVPTQAEFFLEIFANKIDDSNKIGDDPNATMMPFRLKCACKFKIICQELVGKMHPLPNCASGEWGPSKGQRHFGLKPMTHMSGVIGVDNDTEVHFKMPRSLHFLCKLRMNGVDDHLLEKYVTHSVHDNTLSVRVRAPQTGQYGLDIYARPEDAADNHTLAHACKYLLNVTRVDHPVDLPINKVDSGSKMSKDKYGPSSWFTELGLKTLSHPDPKIEKFDPSFLTIEIGHSEASMKFSYHLIREPDEDQRDKVTVKENGKKVKFILGLSKPGNYLLAIYARRKKDPDMLNVYNYVIKYNPGESPTDTKKRNAKKGLFKK